MSLSFFKEQKSQQNVEKITFFLYNISVLNVETWCEKSEVQEYARKRSLFVTI